MDFQMEKNMLLGGWTNPFEKYESKWIISPCRDEHKKNIWNHHLAWRVEQKTLQLWREEMASNWIRLDKGCQAALSNE